MSFCMQTQQVAFDLYIHGAYIIMHSSFTGINSEIVTVIILLSLCIK